MRCAGASRSLRAGLTSARPDARRASTRWAHSHPRTDLNSRATCAGPRSYPGPDTHERLFSGAQPLTGASPCSRWSSFSHSTHSSFPAPARPGPPVQRGRPPARGRWRRPGLRRPRGRRRCRRPGGSRSMGPQPAKAASCARAGCERRLRDGREAPRGAAQPLPGHRHGRSAGPPLRTPGLLSPSPPICFLHAVPFPAPSPLT